MSSIEKAFSNISKEINTKQRKLALTILGDLHEITPRDTGRAASSWRMTLNVVDPTVEPKGKGLYVPNIPDLPDLKGSENTIYITNNLPYIVPLNNGHSDKAGKFFIQTVVKSAIARVA
jgi:hypothetical protein